MRPLSPSTAARTHIWLAYAPGDAEGVALIVATGRVIHAGPDLLWARGHRFANIRRYLSASGCRLERLSAS